ncbi:glycosyl hydrolase catalytic core domain-containing protein [Sarocladium implicatum]|nr:glycosyl hydrolase catalytic core domain-containing protein [Sarocladium implicatum]
MPTSPPRKRCLLWDWTNTRDRPSAIDQLFTNTDDNNPSPFISCHNWNTWVPPELKDRLTFQPTLRTLDHLTSEEFAWVRDSPYPVVHFLNEPERQGVTPTEAAKAWKEKIVPELVEGQGKKMISPACASDQQGKDWLARFFEACSADGEGRKPDYLGLHYYGPEAEGAKAYLREMHDMYELPVLVSEIASISRDEKQVEAFTEEMGRWMDGKDWIIEYGFFGCMAEVADDFVSDKAQLMDKHGNFTGLMRKLMAPLNF